jgi:hypothetical protein
MNVLLVVFVLSVALLALDLWTAPKHSEAASNLKEGRRAV